ncbi:MAG: HAD family hydrolase [Bdellovibrionales bacterium]|nr:HAD family hydrolase [Bdellovibrionales bacterium]
MATLEGLRQIPCNLDSVPDLTLDQLWLQGVPQERRGCDLTFRASYNFSLKPELLVDIRWIGFDFDGLLANGIDYHELVAQAMLGRYGYTFSLSSIRSAREQGIDLWDLAIDRITAPDDSAVSAENEDVELRELLRDDMRELERKHYAELRDEIVICDAAREYWERLPIDTFIITNRYPEEARQGVGQLSLPRLESALYNQDAEAGIRPKPFADMLQKAVDERGLEGRGITLDDSAYNLGPMASNAERVGIEISPIGILPPGYGFSKKYELGLRRMRGANGHRARIVLPDINHFFKELARAMGDEVWAQAIKKEIKARRHEIEAQMAILDRVDPGQGHPTGVLNGD